MVFTTALNVGDRLLGYRPSCRQPLTMLTGKRYWYGIIPAVFGNRYRQFLFSKPWYYLSSIPLSKVNFSKGSHPLSFQSFLCTVQYSLYLLARPENLFRSFLSVSKCLIHRYHIITVFRLFLSKSEPACWQYLRQYRTRTKHENFGRYGIPSKNRSRLPTSSSPRSVEALCFTWWHQ